jgi:hypothetical protein
MAKYWGQSLASAIGSLREVVGNERGQRRGNLAMDLINNWIGRALALDECVDCEDECYRWLERGVLFTATYNWR